MGNRRFRLSDMMPNAWFYKLRDMSIQAKRQSSDRSCRIYTRKQSFPASILPANGESPLAYHPGHDSFYSNERSPMTLAEHLSYGSPYQSSAPETRVSSDSFDEAGSWSSSCSPTISSSTADIIFDMDNKSVFVMERLKKFDSHMALPPIMTKAASKYEQKAAARAEAGKAWYHKCDDLHQEIRKSLNEHRRSLSAELLKQETNSRRRRPQATAQKVRGRNSPRSSLSESYAVIKCSYDPEKDFRDSMMEMIMAHRIQASQDLEDLLACYLTLNSDEHHNHIVEAFERIWCDIFCT